MSQALDQHGSLITKGCAIHNPLIDPRLHGDVTGVEGQLVHVKWRDRTDGVVSARAVEIVPGGPVERLEAVIVDVVAVAEVVELHLINPDPESQICPPSFVAVAQASCVRENGTWRLHEARVVQTTRLWGFLIGKAVTGSWDADTGRGLVTIA
ncbi:MAG: hypothetical protein HY984_01280 [Candidatus Magasanikbacteria bacterium]|nr:hypothetical protein [Candidatus Magasanikbacteria bacterium]